MNTSTIRYGIYRALLGLALGVFLLINPENSLEVLVRLIAFIFIISGMFSLFFSWKRGREMERAKTLNKGDSGLQRLLILNAFVNVIFAILLFVFPNFFTSLVWILVGLVLVLASVMQFVSLVQFRKAAATKLAWYLYAAPVFVFTLSIVILCNPFKTAVTLTIFSGIICIVYALFEIIQAICQWRIHKNFTPYTVIDSETATEATTEASTITPEDTPKA